MKERCGVTHMGGDLSGALKVSPDGYVRMTWPCLMALPLVHFLSGLDDDPVRSELEGGMPSWISGYTEWLSTSRPVVTVGWDWRIELTVHGSCYVRDGGARSNLMLVDTTDGRDLGSKATAIGIGVWIDQSGWEAYVAESITTRYS